MPSTPTVLSALEGTGTGSLTTPTLAPSANSLLLVLVEAASGGGVVPNSCSSTFTTVQDGQGRNWHPVFNYYSDPGTLDYTDQQYGANNVTHQLWWAVTTANPGSGTVTFGTAGGVSILRGQVLEITGDIDLDDPVRQYDYAGTSASASAQTSNLQFSPLADSLLISFLSGRSEGGAVSADTGWTELAEYITNSFSTNVQHRTGAGTQYGGSFANTQTNGIALSAIEIRADAGAVQPPTVLNEYQFENSGNTQTVPEGGATVTVGPNDWVFLGIITRGGGAARTVSLVTSTFDLTSAGWQRIVQSGSIGSANIRTEWWYAQAANAGVLTGTITITWDSSWWGVKGAYVLSFPASAVADNPIGNNQVVSQATNLPGGSYLEGTFATTPALTSRILSLGVSSPNSTQLFLRPRMGYTYVGPPTDEGSSHTRHLNHGQGDPSIGGRFGLISPSHDATEGAVWTAIEILAASSSVVVSPGELVQLQALDAVGISQDHQLSAADIAQLQVLDSPGMSQDHQLGPGEVVQLQVLNLPTLTVTGTVSPGDLVQLQALDAVVLSQDHQLTPSELTQLQALGAASVSIPTDYIPDGRAIIVAHRDRVVHIVKRLRAMRVSR